MEDLIIVKQVAIGMVTLVLPQIADLVAYAKIINIGMDLDVQILLEEDLNHVIQDIIISNQVRVVLFKCDHLHIHLLDLF